MADDGRRTNVQVNVAGVTGGLWYIGWLFTVAYANLELLPALLALIIWPYYLGVAAR